MGLIDYSALIDESGGGVFSAAVTVVSYFDQDGEMHYSVHTKGDVPLSTTLGLLEIAKHDLFSYGNS